MSEYFITGTDTGVGKTVVACALLAAATRRGLNTAALKPVETGCLRDARGALAPADAASLHAASGATGDPLSTCVHAFETPAAPAIAARCEGSEVSLAAIAEAITALRTQRPDFLVVEGAGGLLVPFTTAHTAADLARQFGLPLLVVARPGLGTLNHCALTVECARHRGLDIRGIIFSTTAAVDPGDITLASNALEVERLTGVPMLGTLPELSSLALTDLAAAAERHLDLDAIFL